MATGANFSNLHLLANAAASAEAAYVHSGVGLIIYYKDSKNAIHILMGQESKYCSDGLYARLINPDTNKSFTSKDEFKNMEKYADSDRSGYVQAKAHFKTVAARLSERNGIIIHTDTPVYDVTSSAWKVHFRFLDARSKYGVIKGQRNYPAEHDIDIIGREVLEEVGVYLRNVEKSPDVATFPGLAYDTSKLQRIGMVDDYVFYALGIHSITDKPDEFKAFIESRIRARDATYIGEMYNLQFMSVDDILPILRSGNFNRKSGEALNTFLRQKKLIKGGFRRAHRTKRRRRSHYK